MAGLVDYDLSDDEEMAGSAGAAAVSAAPAPAATSMAIVAAPAVVPKDQNDMLMPIDPKTKEVFYNPTYEELHAPSVGPRNPFKAIGDSMPKNSYNGYVEAGDVSAFHFENQRRTFGNLGYALDPSVNGKMSTESYVGDVAKAQQLKGSDNTTFQGKRPGDKRKRVKAIDPADIDGYKGPWARYHGEMEIAAPTEEEMAVIEGYRLEKEQKMEKQATKEKKDDTKEEKSKLHIEDAYDYQGRSFLHAPKDLGIKWGQPPDRCYLPKKQLHVWKGHSKGVSALRLFPVTAHLVLSCSMDNKVKLWELHGKRRCIQTYMGHTKAVRDICFNNSGVNFLSCGYDRMVRLWDTETGECVSRFTNKKIPYCVKFHPHESKQHLFVVGTSDKKILCWDTRTKEIVQEYDRHLGAVNSITFVEGGNRMVTTSDDKSIRVWEWDVPVDFKYIADPGMHSMPTATMHPNGRDMALQGMDNIVHTLTAQNKFRLNRKKQFKGHLVAGYACQTDFSPDGLFLASGDSKGRLCIWDWRNTKMVAKLPAHDNVCIAVAWDPNSTSRVLTAGWDGAIKLFG